MSSLRLAGLIGSLLALLGLVTMSADRFRQKARADAAVRCDRAAALDSAPLGDCLDQVREQIGLARRAQACEAALLPSLRPETRFAMAQACGGGVKHLVAVADGAVADRADLTRQLAEQRAGEDQAIARAEARAARQQERDDHASKAIATAPRDAGGSIHCDADCLRQLGE